MKKNYIGLMMEEATSLVVGVLGILKSGNYIVPISPIFPDNRVNFIVNDCKITLLLTDQTNYARARQIAESCLCLKQVICIDDVAFNRKNKLGPSTAGTGKENMDNPVYVIYTSGSTGKPKGVQITNRNLVPLLSWFLDYFQLGEHTRVLQNLSYTFDFGMFELLTTFLASGSLYFLNKKTLSNLDEYVDFIQLHHINTLHTTPSFFINIITLGRKLSSLKLLHFGGERLNRKIIEDVSRQLDENCHIYNGYGPTETTINSSIFPMKVEKRGKIRVPDNIPIGKPTANNIIYILDTYGNFQPQGVVGELYIGGSGVAEGYLNQVQLSVEMFMDNPYLAGDRLYRTGDLGRWLPDGNIEFLGRIDHQVKIRGYRIELDEIKNQVEKHPQIKEAVVVVNEDENRDKLLCAYYLSKTGISVPGLREGLAAVLPEYMIPSYFIHLERITLTPNGKIDRQALPPPEAKSDTAYAAPRNKTEEKLIQLWGEILGIEKNKIGIDDNFFELGGHSLKATVMAARIHREMNRTVPLAEIFKTPTIRQLAEFIRDAEESKHASIEAVEKKEYHGLSSAQKRLYILQQMELGGTAYNMPRIIPLSEKPNIKKLEDTFIQLIHRHESFRTSFHIVKDEPVQEVHDEVEFEIEYYDLKRTQVKINARVNVEEERSPLSEGTRGLAPLPIETAARGSWQVTTIISSFTRPFDLSLAPLLHVGIVKTKNTRYLLLIDMHHIICDGVSHLSLEKDFTALYQDEVLPPLRIQYKDFSQWQNSEREQENLKLQEKYWLKGFEGEIPVLELPTDYPRPAIQSFEGSSVSVHITREKTKALNKIALDQGTTMFMVCLALTNILFSKLCGQEDIVIGSPIAGRRHADLEKIIGMFVNTLALRNFPAGEKTFQEFLKEVKERTLETFEHQDYPFEDLVERLAINRDTSRNPLFDVMFSLQDIEVEPKTKSKEKRPAMNEEYSQYENRISKFDLSLAAVVGERLYFSFEYSTKLFKKETIKRFVRYFKTLVGSVLEAPGKKISGLEIIPQDEKRRLLVEFNNTGTEYPKDKSMQELFEAQVVLNPDNLAVVFEDKAITYRVLNQKANRLGSVLREKGVKPDSIVGIMVKPSLEMIIGIFAIWKSGGAYLPIEPGYPQEHIKYMLEDSETRLLLTREPFANIPVRGGESIDLADIQLYNGKDENLENINRSMDLAYVIYTSGSTGKSKGVLIAHRNIVEYIFTIINMIKIDGTDIVLQQISLSFDASMEEIYPTLFKGAKMIVVSKEIKEDLDGLAKQIEKEHITLISVSPLLLNEINKLDKDMLRSIRLILVGGDVLIPEFIDNIIKDKLVYNGYGPTETTVCATFYKCNEQDARNIPIGNPIGNMSVYIVGKNNNLLPIGVPGELWISGDGVARGYLNRGELTGEKFIANPFVKGERVYKSGDLARWLPDSNIEFLGRIDHQVKIRGFRIECGEIENQLLKHEKIKEAVVLVKKNGGGEKYLCAYIVCLEKTAFDHTSSISEELKEYLSHSLPHYMIPSFFTPLEAIPLTPNSKIDRKALPDPLIVTGSKYVAPRDEIEEKLAAIWTEVLGRDPLNASPGQSQVPPGIDDNFFQLGGHSLKAAIMIYKIHKTLNVKLALAEAFKTPTIRGLAEHIKRAGEDKYTSIQPAEEKEYYMLSSAQKRLYILQKLEIDSTAYNMPQFIILSESFEIKKLEETFKKLIEYHESLRTSFHMVEDQPVQRVLKAVEFTIPCHDISTAASKGNKEINNKFIKSFNLAQAPLLRVEILKTYEKKYLLMIDIHHIISDGVSQDILVKDFMAFFEDKSLPSLRIHYKDFSRWQNHEKEQEKIKNQEKYWLKEFEGEIPVLELPTDYPRPALQSFEGNSVSVDIKREETKALNKMALEQETTMFMVLLAVTNILFSKLCGQEDIVIGSPIAGRRHADLEKIIGMFVNTLALRSFPAGGKTFQEFLKEVKERTLEAFEHQDYQFEELVEKVAVNRHISRNPLFDIMFVLNNVEEEISGMEEEPSPYSHIKSKFDMTITAVNLNKNLFINFTYSTALFKKETINTFAGYFKQIISGVLKDPGEKISKIEMLSKKERIRVLYEFNSTETEYPKDMTIHRLFEKQVEQTPHYIAVVIESKKLSYQELNQQANQLARLLRSKGIKTDSIVPIMVKRSLEMIVSIMGILKAGGSYLPIDPYYPKNRIKLILADSGAQTMVTTPELSKELTETKTGKWEARNNLEIIFINSLYLRDFHIHTSSLPCVLTSQPADMAYVIYTSGSAGKPKGVIVSHRSVVNLFYALKNRIYNYEKPVNTALLSPIVFDASIKQIFPALLAGHRLIIVPEMAGFDGEKLLKYYKEKDVQVSDGTPMHLNILMNYKSELLNHFPVKKFIIGGEALELQTGKQLLEIINIEKLEIINVYGPTECCDISSLYAVTNETLRGIRRIPIGKPLSNVKLYILGRNKELQAIGVPGELCISGDGLARGYLNRPELTAEKFDHDLWDLHNYHDEINKSFCGGPGGSFFKKRPLAVGDKSYKTGDLARWLSDGNMEFIGRIDQQVKIRGYRIELGEIENRLLQHKDIKETVVTIRIDKNNDKYLCAHIVPVLAHSTPSTGVSNNMELKRYLSHFLPDYMVPSYFVLLDKIPVTSVGKIDHHALPAPGITAGPNYIAPRNLIETKLVELWSEVLNLEKELISIDDNFFDLGGQSLKATILIAKVHKIFHSRLPLTEVFKIPTIRQLAQYIKNSLRVKYTDIEPLEKKEYYTVSSAQKRLYILQQMELGSTAYNMPRIISLSEKPNIKKLEDTFIQLIHRHESFRTSFHIVGDEPLQEVHDKVEFEIEYYDLKRTQVEVKTRGPRQATTIINSFIRPFDLSLAPLLRVGVVKTKKTQYLLLIDMHHIICDGISQNILTKEFMLLYEGEELPQLRLQYKDYSLWQTSSKQQAQLKEQESYWVQLFPDEIPVLHLPIDYPRPLVQSFEGGFTAFALTGEESKSLKGLTREANATLFMSILCVFNILLSKLSGQEDIVVGTPIAGRRHSDLECIIGMFVNTLPLRNYPSGEKTVKEFLQEIKDRTLEAFENQEHQFEDLVEQLSVPRDAGRNPLFDVMFNLLTDDDQPGYLPPPADDEISQEGDEGEEIEESSNQYEQQTAKFDLTLTVTVIGKNQDERLVFHLEYCRKLFNRDTLQRLTGYLKNIISIVTANPATRIADIDIMPGEEKRKLLYEFNDNQVEYPADKTMAELFEEQVEQTPDAIAVSAPGAGWKTQEKRHPLTPGAGPYTTSAITYNQLNRESNRLAYVLRGKGVTPDTIAAIMVERCLEMIIAIYAILKSGAAYLPIDPNYPEERIRFMLQDSESQILLSREQFVHHSSFDFEGEVLNIREESLYPDHKDGVNPEKVNTGENLVYMIYTSGSTGKPKGAMVKISSFTNLMYWYTTEFNINASDCVFLVAPISFDLAQKNLYASLIKGGTLCLTTPGLPDYQEWSEAIAREQVTIINSAPSVFYPLIEFNTGDQFIRLKSLRYVFLGGEPIQGDKLARWYHCPNCQCELVNTYGPTECTDIATSWRVSKQEIVEKKNIPIGTPIYNVSLFVMDRYRQLLPIGVMGELCIGGISLSKGYHKNAALTAEKFITSPHLPVQEVYRTGDLARWLSDGVIEFLGRVDSQVKVRGNRVELGEIESRLLSHPVVKEVVVTAHATDSGDNYLCAYLVCTLEADLGEPPDTPGLREYLSGELPDYMVPSYFVWLRNIPLTPSGKVDKRALPLPEPKEKEEDYAGPMDDVEVKLVEIWSEVLGIAKKTISIDGNFFELGGHSLKATIMIAGIHKALDVKLPLVELFKTPTIRQLAQYIKNSLQVKYTGIEPVEKKEYYTVSSAQKRLYILQQMELGGTAYNMPQIIPLPGKPNIKKLEDTFIQLIHRHESFRTSFHIVADEPVQRIHDEVEFEIEYDGLQVTGASDRCRWEEGPFGQDLNASGEITQAGAGSHHSSFIIHHSFIRPFDLSLAPLLRVGIVKTKKTQYLLLIDMHHIICDGVSHLSLEKDFTALYQDEVLPPMRIQYKDFSQWQNSKQNSKREQENLRLQEKYWLKEFEGEIPVLELPTDYPRPAFQSFEGSSVSVDITREESKALNKMALEQGTTMFMVLLAVTNILFSKLCGQEDIVIGSPIAGRRHADLEKIIGMFVNTLALRNFPAGEKTFREFLKEVKERTLEAFENQDYQFEELVEKAAVNRNVSRNPLFDVMFIWQNMTPEADSRSNNATDIPVGNQAEQNSSPSHNENILQTSKFDLTLSAAEVDRKLVFLFQYCTKLFKKETIERFIIYLKKLASSIVSNPGKKLSQIDMISEEERNQVLYNFNNTLCQYPEDKSLHRLFEEQVERTPDNIAVVGQSAKRTTHDTEERHVPYAMRHAISYRELDKKSHQLVRLLKQKGVQSGAIVGILVERTIEMIMGIMGILKAGSAYLPIDPDLPQNRIDYMLTDTGTKFLVTTSSLSGDSKTGRWEDNKNMEMIFLNASYPSDCLASPPPGTLASHPSKLAYTIYTSGSTGKPKGVMIEQKPLVNFIKGITEIIDFKKDDGILSLTTISFDIFGLETLLPLNRGSKVVVGTRDEQLSPESASRVMERENITIFQTTPSRLQLFVMDSDASRALEPLKYLLVGGEAFPPVLLEEARKITRGKIYNLYGPTETTIWSTVKDVTGVKPLNIGKPIANTQIYILDRLGSIRPLGAVGELFIGGEGLARGYLNRPELTAEKFVHDLLDLQDINKKGSATLHHSPQQPITQLPHSPIYRTGDLARWLTDGNIEFLGRMDHQVKIRGFRIELEEIENQLLNHNQVKEAVVVTKPALSPGEQYLCAYIVPHQDIDNTRLREYLSWALPHYMIPSHFVTMEKLPLTPSGKLDQQALPPPEAKSEAVYTAPKNITEEKLTQLWGEMLGIEKSKIGIDDSFFELGGHSLKATIMLSKIHSHFNVRVPLTEIFKTPTIQSLAKYININLTDVEITSKKDDHVVLLKKGLTKANHLFFIHDGSGEVEGYVEFCQCMDAELDLNCWGIRADSLKNHAPLNLTIEEIAAKYIRKIRSLQPQGPYFIVGWSIGGTIAFEMTRQLEQMNEKIAFFALIDSPPPQDCTKENVPTFTLESEKNFIKKYLWNREIEDKLENITDINDFWPAIAAYLEAEHWDVEIIRKVILEYEAHVVPNYDQLNIDQLIEYLNVARTFTTARELYIPPGKIQPTVHYFVASQSKNIQKESWNDYCCKPINSYEITGDHYSILKKPSVIDFSRMFGIIIATTMKKKVIIGNRYAGTKRSKGIISKNK